MENTLENKAKFFALYWGQPVAIITKGSCTHPLGTIHLVDKNSLSSVESEKYTKHRYSLELKLLSSISEEDAIEASKTAYNLSFTYNDIWLTNKDSEFDFITIKSNNSHHSFDIDLVDGQLTMYQDDHKSDNTVDHYAVLDFLRSRGYAIPWMRLSVEKLIEYGWIRLNQN